MGQLFKVKSRYTIYSTNAARQHTFLSVCQNYHLPTSLSQWDHSNPIPYILLGLHCDKKYWGMSMHPYELNGLLLYQDHPAGQGHAARGYDVDKLFFLIHTAFTLPHPELSPAAHVKKIAQINPHLLIVLLFAVVLNR